MSEPLIQDPQTLEPVHAGDDAAPKEVWTPRLILFLRLMACAALIKGLSHWYVVCGFDAPTHAAFADYTTPYQSATVFFAVIDLVAAVGLWLCAALGAGGLLAPGIFMYGGELLV